MEEISRITNNKINFPSPTKTIWGMLGPSIVFVALSLNGGEMLLWPDLIGKYGLFIMIAVPVILLLQYFVNIEIERYTVSTGKNTTDKLIETVEFFKYLFPFLIIISLGWPGWASNAGNTIAYLLTIPQYGAVISTILMFFLLFIWFSKKSYSAIENISKIGLFTVLSIAIYVVINGFLNFGIGQKLEINLFPQTKDSILYVSALAFGGVTGVLNLVQSNWIQNKQYGASSVLEKINYETRESKENWKKWFRLIQIEHFILFYIGNLVGILLIGFVAYFTLFGENISGFNLLSLQVDKLNNNGILGYLWGIGIIFLFTMAQITIIDASGRLISRSIKHISNNTSSQLFGLFGLLILVITIFVPDFNQPSLLIQISAVSSAFIMSIYPPILLIINNKLPSYMRPKLWNIIGVIACSLFYLICSLWIIYYIIKS